MQRQPGEIILNSLKSQPKSFVEDIKGGLAEFENYLKNDFGEDVSFNFLVYERTGLIYQIRLQDEPDEGT